VAALDVDRFDMKYSSGRLPHENLMRNIELYGTEVVPMVRELLAEEAELLASRRSDGASGYVHRYDLRVEEGE
jgi:hypothetical protein